MKKLLLSLCALFAAISMNAQYSVNDYVYTATAKYKVQRVLDLPAFAEWYNYSSEIFSPYTAATEDDFDGIQSTRSDEGDFISYALPIQYGKNYIITMKFMATADGTTSITNGGQNQIDAWVSHDDDQGARVGSTNFDYTQVGATSTVVANQWAEISWAFSDTLTVNAEPSPGQDEPGGYLNILFSRINTECVIANNIQVVEVEQVYDTRISDRLIDYAKKIIADDNFNTAAAADTKTVVEEDIAAIEDAIAAGEFDDQVAAEEAMSALMEDLGFFMDVESNNMAKFLSKIDITSIGNIGRGRDGDFGCFERVGGNSNWGHLSGDDALRWAIQKGYGNATASIAVVSKEFPAGKYFMTCELRNANDGKDSWPCIPTYTLETVCKLTLGNVSQELAPISGEQFQKFYIIGEVTEDGQFRAQIDWPGADDGGIFEVRAVEVRSFGDDIISGVERYRAWTPFKAQYDAAKSARETLLAKAADSNYPWANDTIQSTIDRWDPFFNKVTEDNWIGADGNDTGVATNEELIEWTTIQGYTFDEHGEEADYETYKEYAVVRGYQKANDYIVAQNKPIADLQAKIAECKGVEADPMNFGCDHETYLAVIAQAEAILADVIANTNDDKQEADTERLNNAIADLDDATQTFKDSGVLKPFIDIDFSGSFATTVDEEDPTIITSYYIDGKTDTYNGAGQMVFSNVNNVQTDPSKDEAGHFWQLGFGDAFLDVLRVGGGANSPGTVELGAENIPTDDEILRVEFDLWLGNLGKGYLTVECQNAEGQRLGGFSIDRYNGKVAFNDFNNVTGATNDHEESTANGGDGMNIRQYATGLGSSSVGNAGICTDDNKSHFSLVFDFKALALQGTVENGKNGKCEGAEMPMLHLNDASITDNKVAKFVLSSNYASANNGAQARRCWFDNLQMFKYPSQAEGPHFEPNVTPATPGDVNEDEKVDISDIVAIINQIAGTAQYDNADVNGDGKVDISDIVAVINIIAGQ